MVAFSDPVLIIMVTFSDPVLIIMVAFSDPVLIIMVAFSDPVLIIMVAFSDPVLIIMVAFSDPVLIIMVAFSDPVLIIMVTFLISILLYPCNYARCVILPVISRAEGRIASKTLFFPVIAQNLLQSCAVLETVSKRSWRHPACSSLFCEYLEKYKGHISNFMCMSLFLSVIIFTSLTHWLLHICCKFHVIIHTLWHAGNFVCVKCHYSLVLKNVVTFTSVHAKR